MPILLLVFDVPFIRNWLESKDAFIFTVLLAVRVPATVVVTSDAI
jgi:hypothetical protein